MRKMLVIAALAGATLFAPGLTPEARASHQWSAIGTAFRVGAAHIAFVFGHSIHGYGPAYFYRYDRPVHYRGHACSRQCFHDAGYYYYHHDSCPLVAAHFGHYRVDPRWAFDRYAPRHGAYGGDDRDDYYRGDHRGDYGYDDRHDRYDRDDRYDRHDRYDRYDRYDRRDRYDDRYRDDRRHGRRGRGHRHHSGCDRY